MRSVIVTLLACVVGATPASAQLRALAGTVLTTTDTSSASVRVGCTVGTTTCTGGVTAGSVTVGDGAVGSPTFTFASDTDTGWYRQGSGIVALTIDGSQRAQWATTGSTLFSGTLGSITARNSASGAEVHILGNNSDTAYLTFTEGVTDRWAVGTQASDTALYFRPGGITTPAMASLTSGGVWLVGNGASGSPSLSFGSDTDTGLYRVSDGVMGYASNGTDIVSFTSSGVSMSTGKALYLAGGSVSAPSVVMGGDADSGLVSDSASGVIQMGWDLNSAVGYTYAKLLRPSGGSTGEFRVGVTNGSTGSNAILVADITKVALGVPLLFSSMTFAGLGTPTNGTLVYCSDCTVASPCAGGGTGAFAKRLNGGWVCN